jgi:hypothetical protein
LLQGFALKTKPRKCLKVLRSNTFKHFLVVLLIENCCNYKEEDMIELKSINLTFAIAQIYRGLVLTNDNEISQEG